jgi:hypothetical protein
MPFRAHRLAIGIVVELDEFRSPPNEHRVARSEHQSHRNPQTLRPCFRGAERRFCPVVCSRQSAHLAATGQEVADCPSVRHTRNFHSDARRQTYSQSSSKYNVRVQSKSEKLDGSNIFRSRARTGPKTDREDYASRPFVRYGPALSLVRSTPYVKLYVRPELIPRPPVGRVRAVGTSEAPKPRVEW